MALTSTTGTVNGSSVTFEITGSGAGKGVGVIAYIDYTKNGDTLTCQASFNDAKIDSNFYNQIQINSLVLENVVFSIGDTGKYRISLPTALNEESVKLTFSGLVDGDLNVEFSKDQGFV